MNKIEHNIAKIYLIKSARWLMLTTPYLPLFMGENGIDKSSYSLLAAIHALSIIVLEIPSGYLADVIGRKKTLVLGSVLGAFGYVVYSLSFSFSGFLLAMVSLGVGQSLISGSDSALLYETLVAMKKQGEYSRYEGRLIALGSFMETVGAPLGGLLAAASLRYPFMGQALVALIAVPAALTLIEPQDGSVVRGRSGTLLPALKKSLLLDRKLLLLVVYSSLIGAGTYTMAKAIPYWYNETVHSSALELGIFWSALNLCAAVFSSYAYKVERKVDRLTFMTGIGLVVSLSFFGLGYASPYPAIALLFLFYCCRGLATPILKNYINDHTSSDIRATVLSVRMFLVYVMFAVLFPVMGWVGDLSNWGNALMLAGSYFSLFSSAAIVVFYLVQKQKEPTVGSAQLDLTTD
ncbi:MAG: MFS transporter [Desulfuromonas sp.]|nr:MFS transporter [Desulfuromonas sp.]